MKRVSVMLCISLLSGVMPSSWGEPQRFISEESVNQTVSKLIQQYGNEHEDRIRTGVNRVAAIWWAEDGSEEDMAAFCEKHYIADDDRRTEAINKIDRNFEVLLGHIHQINRALRSPFTLNLGDPRLEDDLFVKAIPKAVFYDSKVAFFVALNFPHYFLEEMIAQGPQWTRQQWAAARIGEMFTERIPPDTDKTDSRSRQKQGSYFEDYFICMDRVLTADHEILFPDGLKLSCHHGLRDNLKGQYTRDDGLARQELIFTVMLRIIDQSIPQQVINNSNLFWDPESNSVYKKEQDEYVPVTAEPENGHRYQNLLDVFNANKVKDPYYPTAPTFIQRAFNNRQMPEEAVEKLILSILASPEAPKVASLISKRIGRPLRPFDIWYSGFQAQSGWSEDQLDSLVREKYPTPAAFQSDIPVFLKRLGFSEEKARFLGDHVVVDPVRIGGHADGAAMRGDKSHLRTVFAPEGLDYKGFRIGIHEVGHTVHQNLARYGTDYYVLGDVPMSGFSEAIAELFAYRNMKALGLEDRADANEKDMQALASFWYLFEHGGHALTEMRVWRWMYTHPDADADQLKVAVQDIARSTWNEYYAPIFGETDVPILSIYSHFINGSLYLHSYVLGNVIMYQLYDYMGEKDFADELDRMCKLGWLMPDLWMERAVDSPVSSAPLLRDVGEALRRPLFQ